MSVEAVRNYFISRGIKDSIVILPESSATVELAAQTIGVEPKLIAKTLAFELREKDILIVMSGDARVDNKKFKQYFHTKARMLHADKVLEATGHPVGGLCPFGLKNDLDIFMDISLKQFEYVYPAAGEINAALKITPENMQEITGAIWVDVCQQ